MRVVVTDAERLTKMTVNEPEFIGHVELRLLRSSHYEIINTFAFRSPSLNLEIKIYPGFQTIFDNIPRIPGIHALLKGRAELSAIVHDIIYRLGILDDRTFTRKEADVVMEEAMRAEKINAFYRYCIYLGIRIGGWYFWNKYRSGQWEPGLEVDPY